MSQTPIRVLLASPSFPQDATDWRSVFILRMTEALAENGGVSLSLWSPRGAVPAGVEYVATPTEEAWLAALSEEGGIARKIRASLPQGTIQGLKLCWHLRRMYRRTKDVDVIHANWLQLAIPLRQDKRPLLVTALGSDMHLLRLPGIKALLRRQFSARPTVVCPNAEWMVNPLTEMFGRHARIAFVPFGIDEAYFRINREEAKPPFRWLCISRVTSEKIGTLFDWGEAYFSSGVRELHLIGPMQGDVAIPSWVHYHGAASQSEILRQWFPAATGLISLSRHPEGRPQVMLEAMAAGLPLIASALEPHIDLIEGAEAGVICRSPDSLSQALLRMETSEGLSAGALGREFVSNAHGTWADCAARYIDLYRWLVNR